jgi:hypothetical protein
LPSIFGGKALRILGWEKPREHRLELSADVFTTPIGPSRLEMSHDADHDEDEDDPRPDRQAPQRHPKGSDSERRRANHQSTAHSLAPRRWRVDGQSATLDTRS